MEINSFLLDMHVYLTLTRCMSRSNMVLVITFEPEGGSDFILDIHVYFTDLQSSLHSPPIDAEEVL